MGEFITRFNTGIEEFCKWNIISRIGHFIVNDKVLSKRAIIEDIEQSTKEFFLMYKTDGFMKCISDIMELGEIESQNEILEYFADDLPNIHFNVNQQGEESIYSPQGTKINVDHDKNISNHLINKKLLTAHRKMCEYLFEKMLFYNNELLATEYSKMKLIAIERVEDNKYDIIGGNVIIRN